VTARLNAREIGQSLLFHGCRFCQVPLARFLQIGKADDH
jgi:hypothetical protein